MKNILGRKWSKLAAVLSIALLLAIGSAAYFHESPILADETIRLDRPFFYFTQRERLKLDAESKKGDCASAYKLAQYHLYSSLDMRQAEKYFRLAAKCPDSNALAGLITVLRKPEHDAEIDKLLVRLKKIDPQQGGSASEEIALRRAERGSR